MTTLRPCPDCAREISPRATSCPHCGAPMAASPIHGARDGVAVRTINCGCAVLLAIGALVLAFVVVSVAMAPPRGGAAPRDIGVPGVGR